MVNKLSVFKEYTQKYEKYRKKHDLILGICSTIKKYILKFIVPSKHTIFYSIY